MGYPVRGHHEGHKHDARRCTAIDRLGRDGLSPEYMIVERSELVTGLRELGLHAGMGLMVHFLKSF